MYIPGKPEDVNSPGPTATWLQVVGVVGAVKLRGLEEGENARAGAYYMPYAQSPTRGIGWAIRSSGDVAAIDRRRAARARRDRSRYCADRCRRPCPTALKSRSISARADAVVVRFWRSRTTAGLDWPVRCLRLSRRQRTREFGIRMALGSEHAKSFDSFSERRVVSVTLGLVAGVAGTIALRSAIAAQLYGVGALDPQVMLGAIAAPDRHVTPGMSGTWRAAPFMSARW